MLRRLYVHNFRCLENFELSIGEHHSALLIGKNGSGKSTVGRTLGLLQQIARGTNRIDQLIEPKDITRGRVDTPVRFEIDVELGGVVYEYSIAFELPRGSKELRIFAEKLSCDRKTVYSRELEKIHLPKTADSFLVNQHLVALPIIHEGPFIQWLSNMLVLRPIPELILGGSHQETLQLDEHGINLGAWFSAMLANTPAAYADIDGYLKEVMPDFKDIKNPSVGADARSLVVQFSKDERTLTVPFADLSDGEKCFMLCALVLAANRAYGPLFCFWDEPDNYLALSEVGHFLTALRKEFQAKGQLLATSHNPEAIRRFSDENTFHIFRKSHLEPSMIRLLSDIPRTGDLITSLLHGDLES